MSEGLVNIDLPWHILEYTYQQRTWMEVLELLQWWHGRIWLSMAPPFWCGPKRRRAPCQLRWIIKVRSYTQLVCRNHGPRWYDPLAQCFGIGGVKYVSFLCIWACAKQGGVEKPRIIRGAFLFFVCVGAASDAMQSWQQMRVMARLCKRVRARLGGARWRNVFLLKCIATDWRRAQDSLWHV